MTAPAVRGRLVCWLYHATGSLVRPPVTEPERIRNCPGGAASRIAGKAHPQLREHRLRFDPGGAPRQ